MLQIRDERKTDLFLCNYLGYKIQEQKKCFSTPNCSFGLLEIINSLKKARENTALKQRGESSERE
jgi:hypothetical protein